MYTLFHKHLYTGPFQRSYDTTSDFWRMIFQERCETLVMLTQPVEDGVCDCILHISITRHGGKLTLARLAEMFDPFPFYINARDV